MPEVTAAALSALERSSAMSRFPAQGGQWVRACAERCGGGHGEDADHRVAKHYFRVTPAVHARSVRSGHLGKKTDRLLY